MATGKIGSIGTAAVQIAASVGSAITQSAVASATTATKAGLSAVAGTFSALADGVASVATSVIPAPSARLPDSPYEAPSKPDSGVWFTGLIRDGILGTLQGRLDTAWGVLRSAEQLAHETLAGLRAELTDIGNMFGFINQINRMSWETFTHVSDVEKERRREEAREADESDRRTRYS